MHFRFMLKTLIVLGIFVFYFDIYNFVMYKNGVTKKLINFKIYFVTDWTTNNYNTYIVQYFKK